MPGQKPIIPVAENIQLKLDIFVPDSGRGNTKISTEVKHYGPFSRNMAKILPFLFIHLKLTTYNIFIVHEIELLPEPLRIRKESVE